MNYFKNQNFSKREHSFRRERGRYKDPSRWSAWKMSLVKEWWWLKFVVLSKKKKKKMSPCNHVMLMVIKTVIKHVWKCLGCHATLSSTNLFWWRWLLIAWHGLKKYSWFLLKCGYQDTLVKFKMNQTENEIQRIMYHPLITFVKRKEEITCSCQQKTCFCIHTGVSNVVGFQVATDIFVALA